DVHFPDVQPGHRLHGRVHGVLYLLGYLGDRLSVPDHQVDVHHRMLIRKEIRTLRPPDFLPPGPLIRPATPSISRAAEAAMAASTSSEIWMVPISSGWVTYSL